MIYTKRKKIITIPLCGDVDISGVLPIVDSEIFQRLRFVGQLGTASAVFPGAMNTRFEHSIGVFFRQQRLNRRWAREGWNEGEDILRALEVFALLHDCFHMPLSHVLEYISENHDDRGFSEIGSLREIIEQCGVNYELVESLFKRQNPLYKAVSDKNLGTDKLDYLSRDAHHTNFGGMPEINRVSSHIYWRDEKLVLDAKCVEEAGYLQKTYALLYKKIYLRKAVLITQRLIQKAVAKMIETGELNDKILWKMRDFELFYRLENSKDMLVREMCGSYLARNWPKIFVSIRPLGREPRDAEFGKPVRVFGAEESRVKELAGNFTVKKMAELESVIAEKLALPVSAVLIVPSQGGFRFAPEDINLFDGQKIFKMKDVYPEHYASFEEDGKNHLSIWVCINGERERYLDNAEEVRDLILNS
jgi:HD superfamily phosphohydrolase